MKVTDHTITALELAERLLETDPADHERILAESDQPDEVTDEARRLYLQAKDENGSLETGGAAPFVREHARETPTRIGHYAVVRSLGQGGMGEVFLARREGIDFEHLVCIKMVRGDLAPGRLRELFLGERKTLARFDHPAIARFIDADATGDGEPYVVMEYVPGERLDRWLADTSPDAKTRLDIFQQIAAGVAEAHRHLVIHRDVNPSNILVTEDGRPKLIDFGIAQLEDEAEPGRHGREGTKGFRAPEIERGEEATTRADIFALGRLGEALFADSGDAELAAIFAHAAAEDPNDRYPTVDAMLEEIEDYREGRTVRSYDRSRRYAVGKFVRRNRVPVAIVSAMSAALVAALVFSLLFWQRAEANRALAEDRFEDVREIANFMLFDLYDDLEPISGTTQGRTDIIRRSLAYLEALQQEPDLPADLKFEIGNSYLRLSEVTGSPSTANLGERDQARDYLRRAEQVLGVLYRSNSASRDYADAFAAVLRLRAVFEFISDDDSEATRKTASQARNISQKLAERFPDDEGYLRDVADMTILQAETYIYDGDAKEGIAILAGFLPRFEKQAGKAQSPELVTKLANGFVTMGLLHRTAYEVDDPEFARAIPYFDRGIALQRSLVERNPDRHDYTLMFTKMLYYRAIPQNDLARYDDAIASLDEAMALTKRVARADPDNAAAQATVSALYGQLGHVYREAGRTADAVRNLRRQRDDELVRLATQPKDEGYLRGAASAALSYAGLLVEYDHPDACKASAEAAALWRRKGSIAEQDRKRINETLNPSLLRCGMRKV